MYSIEKIIGEQIEQFLTENNIDSGADPAHLTRLVLSGEVYWEKNLHDHDYSRLVLFKFFSPVVMREEVFLGSVLLNCFLSRQVLLACREHNLGKMALVGNDVENFYYLWVTNATIDALNNLYIKTIDSNLAELYVGENDESKGIYGNLDKMFNFRKSEFEPFPIYSIPVFLERELELKIRKTLIQFLETDKWEEKIKTVLASIAFFYGKTSGGSGDAQSYQNFIKRLIYEYRLLDEYKVKQAFGIQDINVKDAIKNSIEQNKYYPPKLKTLIMEILSGISSQIDAGDNSWSMGFIKSDKKMIEITSDGLVNKTLAQCYLGYKKIIQKPESHYSSISCRLCGSFEAIVRTKMVVGGLDSPKQHNQSIKEESESKICAICALYSYLSQKLLGNQTVRMSGTKYPQVPQQASIIFHYGQHSDGEIKAIAAVLKDAFALVRQRRGLEYGLARLRKEKRDIETRLAAAKGSKTKQNYADQLAEKEREIQAGEVSYQECNRNLLAVLNSTKASAPSPGDGLTLQEPALEIIADADITLDSAEHYIFGIGLGNYRLLAFILPEIKHRMEKKGHDYMQQRFSNSRVTVLTLLAFLRKLCGCDGPWYYLTLPALTQEGFSTDAFYVRGQKYSASQVFTWFEAFSGFANKVVRRGADMLERKIILTERLLEEPLVVLAEVLRKSGALMRQDDPVYNVIYDPIAQRPALEEYLDYFKQFQDYQKSYLQEGTVLILHNEEMVNAFTYRIFRLLDLLGHFPMSLRGEEATPSRLEKYPRLLFGYLQRYIDPSMAFKEWESKVLRDTPEDEQNYKKNAFFLLATETLNWLEEHKEFFQGKEKKLLIQHLRGSLYVRVFAYLYPRREVCLAVARHQQNIDRGMTEQEFARLVAARPELERLRGTFQEEWPAIVSDARENYLNSAAYYRKIIQESLEKGNSMEEPAKQSLD